MWLAGGAGVAQPPERAQLRPLRDHAVLGHGHAEHVDALALEQLGRSSGSKRIVQQRRGAAQPGGNEGVAGLRATSRSPPCTSTARRAARRTSARPYGLPREVAVAVAIGLGSPEVPEVKTIRAGWPAGSSRRRDRVVLEQRLVRDD